MRIYSHYVFINENKIIFYHHSIYKFDFMKQDDKEKWIAYKFTRNVYIKFMLMYLKRICSAINQLFSDSNFDVLQFFQQSNAEFILFLKEDNSQLSQVSFIDSDIILIIFFTQSIEQIFKKSRKRCFWQIKW